MTINIITEQIDFELLEETVRFINYIWRANQSLEDRIDALDF